MKQGYSNRLVSGLSWGLLWTGIVVSGTFMVVPIFSVPLVSGITVVCVSLGIALNFKVVERACPKCGTVSKVMPTGGKCPGCGHSLKVD